MPIDPVQPTVAHGNRRDEVHFEEAPGQVLKVSHLVKPNGPLPRDMAGATPADAADAQAGRPMQDVAVLPTTPSVWDASPEQD